MQYHSREIIEHKSMNIGQKELKNELLNNCMPA
jgi:hypothetical protein